MLSNDELRMQLRLEREWAKQLASRRDNMQRLCEDLGIDRHDHLGFMLYSVLYDQAGCNIAAIRDELRAREQKSMTARVQLNVKPDNRREALERMMRGNYNKYGGEDI